MRLFSIVIAAIFGIFSFLLPSTAAEKLIPMEDFFRNPRNAVFNSLPTERAFCTAPPGIVA